MVSSYYKTPFNFMMLKDHGRFSGTGKITSDRYYLPSCPVGVSIADNLFRLLATRKGDMFSDPEYGCDIWNLEFELLIDRIRWQDTVSASLARAIQLYERRLQDVTIEVLIRDVEVKYAFRQYPEIKSEAFIQVRGTVNKLLTPFHFQTALFISPIAK